MAAASETKETAEKSGSSPSRSSKPESEPSSETTSPHSGDASDRRDADIKVPSAKSEEYRLLFRLPPDEVLVEDFNCAFQENILLQGHMYLFIHHICFYSNIFGFETKKTIPFHEVTCVRKAKTAGIFPNAIEIFTGEKKYFFGSFLSRDEAYRLVIDGWAQHNSDARALLDHQESKFENGPDGAPAIMENGAETTHSADASSSSAHRSKYSNDAEESMSLLKGNNDTKGSDNFSENMENGKDENSEPPSFRSPLTWKIEDLDAPKIPERFTLVTEAKFPVCVEEFFMLFISDSASGFLQRFHQKNGDKELHCTPWRQNEQFGYARDLSFLHPVKILIGAKMGRCREVQKYRVYKNSHLVIEIAQSVSEVPFSDYFHVERIWDVENDGNEENSCILRVYLNLAFSKKTMFKGKIEQATRDELQVALGSWINDAHELLKQKTGEKSQELGDQKTGINQNQEEGVGVSSKLEGPTEILQKTITPSLAEGIVALDNSVSNMNSPPHANPGSPILVASYFRELWTALISYAKSQKQFPIYLTMVVVAIFILMQIIIIFLLVRIPHVVPQGSGISNLEGLKAEKSEWLEKRFDYLKDEMMMVETQMERMRYEFVMLKAHLERFKSKS